MFHKDELLLIVQLVESFCAGRQYNTFNFIGSPTECLVSLEEDQFYQCRLNKHFLNNISGSVLKAATYVVWRLYYQVRTSLFPSSWHLHPLSQGIDS